MNWISDFVGGTGAISVIGALLSSTAGLVSSFSRCPLQRRRKTFVVCAAVFGAVLCFVGGILAAREKKASGGELKVLHKDLRNKSDEIIRANKVIIAKTEAIAELRGEITGLSETNKSLLIGGNSFCYLNLLLGDGSEESPDLVLIHKGRFPLYDVHVSIRDMDRIQEVSQQRPGSSEDLRAEWLRAFQVGNLPPNKVALLGRVELRHAEKKNYFVQVEARNGTFLQPIKLRRVAGRWRLATRVTDIAGRRLLPDRVDQGYPVDERGAIEW